MFSVSSKTAPALGVIEMGFLKLKVTAVVLGALSNVKRSIFNMLDRTASEKESMNGSDGPRLNSNPISRGLFMSPVNTDAGTPILGSTAKLSTSLATPLVKNKNVVAAVLARAVSACMLLMSVGERVMSSEMLLEETAVPPVSV